MKYAKLVFMVAMVFIAAIFGAISLAARYVLITLYKMVIDITKESIRLWPVLLLTMITWYIFISGMYETMSPPVQAVALKTLLTVSGVLVAHIIRKALLPKINWSNDHNWQLFVASYSMYIIIPYCFAMGG